MGPAGGDTFRHPFPREFLAEVFNRTAFGGPPELADGLLAEAVRLRPGWAALYELRAVAALRLGRCNEAVAQFLTLLEFGIDHAEGPRLVDRCRRGRTP